MSGFAPGDVVVCVDAGPSKERRWQGKPNLLVRGRAYAIRDVLELSGEVGLRLVGVTCHSWRGIEWGFAASRFRKIDPASDEFTEQMRALRPHNERVPA